MTKDIEAPPIHTVPADNNEYSTRNRINELLRPSPKFKHPVSGESGRPGIYFIKRSEDYQNGCYHAIRELQGQRRKMIGYVDGKAIYSDDREESISDHAYDCIRYFVSMHGNSLKVPERQPPPHSFRWYQYMKKRYEGQILAGSV